MPKDKKLHLEAIRAFAMLLVIFNHTKTNGFVLYTVATASPLYSVYLFLSIACKVALPLYWMVSGALLLPKEESIAHIYRHRVLRMVLVLLVFGLPIYAAQTIVGRLPPDGGTFFKLMYSSVDTVVGTFWFVAAYIGVMMMLPFLRRLVKAMTVREAEYLFCLTFAFRGLLPIVEWFASGGRVHIDHNITDNLLRMDVIYFIAGYYFENVIPTKKHTFKRCALLLAGGEQ